MEDLRNAASPLRLITSEVTPALELTRTLEALLVVASQPLPLEDDPVVVPLGQQVPAFEDPSTAHAERRPDGRVPPGQ